MPSPYHVLDVTPDASRAQIVAGAARAMQQRRFPVRDIAIAQKELLDPVASAAQRFVHTLDVSPILAELDPGVIAVAATVLELELLDLFWQP